MIDIISDPRCNKATGLNSIPIKIMKLAKDCTANNQSVLFNLSFSSEIFPDKLKMAKILPVFKKGSQLECPNYRPILLLSNLDKIIEKINAQKINGIFEWTKILYCKQYGFHKGFSTAHAIINLTNNIESSIDNKQFVWEVFIDLQKAFDTVDHNILLEKITALCYQRKSSSMV